MPDYAPPVLYALFVWWFATGLILYLDGLPRRTFAWSLAFASALAALALYGLAVTSADASPLGAYLAFTCAIVVWGWNEMSFLMGFVTGPRKTGCHAGCGGWRHCLHAVQSIIYHELAILASAALVVGLAWGGANQVGVWTFLVLWVMRLSAKLNLFLGVPNLGTEFLPEHLRYLESFLHKKPMNLLLPVSVTAGTIVAALLAQDALAAEAGSFAAVGLTLVTALLALAVVEHWFMVLPLPTAALWSWGFRSRAAAPPVDLVAGLIGAGPATTMNTPSRGRP